MLADLVVLLSGAIIVAVVGCWGYTCWADPDRRRKPPRSDAIDDGMHPAP